MHITLSQVEIDTILAALRWFQEGMRCGLITLNGVGHDILAIATNDGTHRVAEQSEIDGLCEKINCTPDSSRPTLFALVSDQGTAAAETGLCSKCFLDPEVCTCGGDGLFYAGPAKMGDFAKEVIPPGWFTVQRCDSCDKFPDDAAAAEAYYIEHRTVQDKQGFHHEIANSATRREPPTLPADMRQLQIDLEKLGLCLSDEQIRRHYHHYLVVRTDLATAKRKPR